MNNITFTPHEKEIWDTFISTMKSVAPQIEATEAYKGIQIQMSLFDKISVIINENLEKEKGEE